MPRQADLSLKLINLRLRKQDIKKARDRARKLGIPYQHVIRAWVAERAASA